MHLNLLNRFDIQRLTARLTVGYIKCSIIPIIIYVYESKCVKAKLR